MYKIIQHSHSGIMWLALVMLILSVVYSFIKLINKEEKLSKQWYRYFAVSKWLLYIQALLGIVLLFISPMVHYGSGFMKNSELRFYGMEHPLMMFIAIALVSLGLFSAKKKTGPSIYRTIFIYFTIALAIVAYMIPWKAVMS